MQYRLVRMAIAFLCITTGAITASAQITTGVVSGALKDEQGAVVPGATVTLVSETRGTKVADAHTNENGDFVFPNVPGDTYTVEVTLEGFKTLRRTGVLVSPGDRVVVPTHDAVGRRTRGNGERQGRGADDPGGQRRAGLHGHDRIGGEPADRQPQLRRVRHAGARRHCPDRHGHRRRCLPARRRRPEQHHDGRRVDDGYGEQRAVDLHERRLDRRSEGPDPGLPGRVRAFERPADLGRHQERHQPVPRLALRHRAELGLELEQLGEHQERRPEGGLEAARLGLLARRADREARRRQPAVLLLQPRVPAA